MHETNDIREALDLVTPKASRIRAVATTGRKQTEDAVTLARWAAAHAGIPYIERRNRSSAALREHYGAEFLLVAKHGLLTLETPHGDLFFHPNMAHLRLKNLRFGSGGEGDRMVEAMDLVRGMHVLDCTLGFGADAIVASFAVGPEGSVTGVESEPLIETVVGYGLQHFKAENWPIQEAMRGVHTVCDEAAHYLKTLPDKSFDVVYFDPMFRHPLMESRSLTPLRTVANYAAVTPAMIEDACRVARHRVVFKENARSHEFARLGFSHIMGGRYSKVHYGVRILDETN